MNVDAAYAEVLEITRREAKNFAYGIMVLPREKRRAIAAVYAFAREVDDIADGELPPDEKQARLEALRAELDGSERPVMVALADARERFGIPREPLSLLVDGGLQDLSQATYASFDALRGYCEKVAGAVGVACIAVYGSDDAEHANTLGIGLQLINIMRDVDEDRRLGRVYLPQDELARFGVTELSHTPEFVELMRFQASRARAHLAEGLRLLDTLDRRSALCVGTFAGLYRATLEEIEARGFDVFGPKARLSAPRKLAVVARGLLP
jgi:phytoene synthase